MRYSMQHLAAMVVTGTMLAGAALATEVPTGWLGQPGNTLQEWSFGTAANPAAPDLAVGVGAQGSAAIAVGEFSIGWQAELPGMGAVSGVWDLGREGAMRLPLPALVSEPASKDRLLLVKVSQYMDGGIYPDMATLGIVGATYVGDMFDLGAGGNVGGWIEDQQVWRVPAGATAAEVVLLGAFNGSLIDRISIEAGEDAVVPVQLGIRALAGEPRQMEITWNAAPGAYVLQSSLSLETGAAWELVDAPVDLAGTLHTVRVNATEAARFFRLVKP